MLSITPKLILAAALAHGVARGGWRADERSER